MGVSSSPRPRHTGSEIEADGPTRNLRPRPGDAAPEAGAARRGEVSQVSASAHANREGDPIEIGAVGSLAGRPEKASRASKFVFQKNALARASQMNMRSALFICWRRTCKLISPPSLHLPLPPQDCRWEREAWPCGALLPPPPSTAMGGAGLGQSGIHPYIRIFGSRCPTSPGRGDYAGWYITIATSSR